MIILNNENVNKLSLFNLNVNHFLLDENVNNFLFGRKYQYIYI